MLSMALGLDSIWQHNLGLAHKGQQKLGLGHLLLGIKLRDQLLNQGHNQGHKLLHQQLVLLTLPDDWLFLAGFLSFCLGWLCLAGIVIVSHITLYVLPFLRRRWRPSSVGRARNRWRPCVESSLPHPHTYECMSPYRASI